MADQFELCGNSRRDPQRMGVRDEAAFIWFDAVLPVAVSAVPDVADLEKVLAGRRDLEMQQRVSEKGVVVDRDHGPRRVAQGQDRIGMFLEVVNLVLQPLTADVKRQGLPRRRLE